MEQISMIIFDTDIDAVTDEIIKLGILHLMDITEIAPWTEDLESAKVDQIQQKYSELSKRLKVITRRLGLEEKLVKVTQKIKTVGADEIEKTMDRIEADVNPLILERDTKHEELKSQQKIFNQVKLFTPLDLKIDTRTRYTFLEMVTGHAEEKNLSIIKKELEPIPSVIMPFRTTEGKVMLLLIVLKKDRVVLEKAMRESSFEKLEVPEETTRIAGDVQKQMKKKITKLQKEIGDIELKVQDEKYRFYPLLLNFIKVLKAKQMSIRAKIYFKKTERTYLISGWVPKNKRRNLIKGIQRVTENRCYIKEVEAEKIEAVRKGKVNVPVQFSNPSFLKPFEFLTSTFGMPKYNVIDPTIFLAITFLIMFGAMFGDVGHGLILGLLGIFLARQKKPVTAKIGALVLYCGVSSIIFGVLYGSYFGMEEILPPLWMRPMHNIMHLIALAIFWGIAVISIGIIINLINAFRSRDFVKGLFDKAGLIGGLIYWGAVGLVIKMFVAKGIVLKPALVIGVIGIPVILLFFKGPIIKLFKPGERVFPGGVFSYVLDTVVELVEIFIGYLANTISFVRIAAFCLAHAGLFIAVFSLVDIVKQRPGGIFYSILILILGNALIITLEGLIVTIQGLRLEYYEFFSKFFMGGGKEYRPLKMG